MEFQRASGKVYVCKKKEERKTNNNNNNMSTTILCLGQILDQFVSIKMKCWKHNSQNEGSKLNKKERKERKKKRKGKKKKKRKRKRDINQITFQQNDPAAVAKVNELVQRMANFKIPPEMVEKVRELDAQHE